MKYTKEELSPTSIKVTVVVDAEEVNAAISSACAMQQKGINIAGFRKGHVPLSLIEKRFRTQIYEDASRDLVNVHLNEILGELKLVPVTGLDIEPTPIPFERDKETTYTVSFEHLPQIVLPDYEGLEVEQFTADKVDDAAVDGLIDRLRKAHTEIVPVDGDGPAVKGQYVNLDVKVESEGKTVIQNDGIDYEVGQTSPVPALDKLATTLKVGDEGSEEVDFPADFMVEGLRGKHGTITIRVHAVKAPKAPTDEELAQKLKLKDVEDLRKHANEEIANQRNVLYRSEAQTKLLEKLESMIEAPLPEALVKNELDAYAQREQDKAQRMGKVLSTEQMDRIREEHRAEAEKHVKSYVILRTVAEKEGLEVSEQELQTRISMIAWSYNSQGSNINPQDLYNYYRESGKIFEVRDELLINKATQALYSKAKVTMVPASPDNDPAARARDASGEETASSAE